MPEQAADVDAVFAWAHAVGLAAMQKWQEMNAATQQAVAAEPAKSREGAQ